jgi:hypothetical protein
MNMIELHVISFLAGLCRKSKEICTEIFSSEEFQGQWEND